MARTLATVREVLDEVRTEGGTVEQQLNTLFEKFVTAVRAIDPTVTGSWIGRDGPDLSTPSFIVFERPGSTFLRRSS